METKMALSYRILMFMSQKFSVHTSAYMLMKNNNKMDAAFIENSLAIFYNQITKYNVYSLHLLFKKQFSL